MSRLPLLLVLIGTWWLTALAGSAEAAPRVITKVPFTINAPGQYVLTKNLTFNGTGNAITVNASDVTIDLRGNVLSGKQEAAVSSDTCGIYANGRSSVTVRNGVVRFFARGVFLDGVTGSRHLVEEVQADQCSFLGIQTKGRGCVLRRNRVTNIGGSTFSTANRYGLHVTGEGAVVEDNIIFDVYAQQNLASFTADAVYLLSAGQSTVARNRIANSSAATAVGTTGVRLVVSSVCQVTGNQVLNFRSGLVFDTSGSGSNAGVYRDNTFTNCFIAISTNGGNKDGGGNAF